MATERAVPFVRGQSFCGCGAIRTRVHVITRVNGPLVSGPLWVRCGQAGAARATKLGEEDAPIDDDMSPRRCPDCSSLIFDGNSLILKLKGTEMKPESHNCARQHMDEVLVSGYAAVPNHKRDIEQSKSGQEA